MSEDNAKHCMAEGIDAYISVGSEKHQKTTDKTEPDSENETWSTMRAKLQTKEGRETYARRKVIVEPVFGHTKEARRFRHFSLRGTKKVRAEWMLVCLCGNLLKLVNSGAFPDQLTLKIA